MAYENGTRQNVDANIAAAETNVDSGNIPAARGHYQEALESAKLYGASKQEIEYLKMKIKDCTT